MNVDQIAELYAADADKYAKIISDAKITILE
jgi:hypothetical protein